MARGTGERVSDVEFSSDGHHVIVIGGSGQVRVYRLSDISHRGRFAAAADRGEFIDSKLSSNQAFIATITSGGTVDLWDRPSG